MRNAAARIGFVPAVVAAAKASLKNPPEIYVRDGDRAEPRGHRILRERHLRAGRRDAAASALTAPCRTAVAALKEYQKFLEKDLLPRATGEWRIGKEKFAKKLELELDAGPDRRRGAARGRGRGRPRRARDVRHRPAAVVEALPGKAAAARRRDRPPRDGRAACSPNSARTTARPRTWSPTPRATVETIKAFIREKDILRLPEPDRCKVIEMPEFQRGYLGRLPEPRPAARPEGRRAIYAISPPPRDWDDRRVANVPARSTTGTCCRS